MKKIIFFLSAFALLLTAILYSATGPSDLNIRSVGNRGSEYAVTSIVTNYTTNQWVWVPSRVTALSVLLDSTSGGSGYVEYSIDSLASVLDGTAIPVSLGIAPTTNGNLVVTNIPITASGIRLISEIGTNRFVIRFR